MPTQRRGMCKTNRRRLHDGFEKLEARLLLDAGAHANPAPAVEKALPADAIADFSLPDLNPASSTFNRSMSPRDFLGDVTAWMFGYST